MTEQTVEVVYTQENWPKTVKRTVYLCGPVEARTDYQHSATGAKAKAREDTDLADESTAMAGSPLRWRDEALRLFEEYNFEGHVFTPEPPLGQRQPESSACIEWEERAMRSADVVLVWLDRHQTVLCLNTNDEYGSLKASGASIVLGVPSRAISVGYQKYYARKHRIPVFKSLADCVNKIVTMLRDPCVRSGPHVHVPAHVYRNAAYQTWSTNLRICGLELTRVQVDRVGVSGSIYNEMTTFLDDDDDDDDDDGDIDSTAEVRYTRSAAIQPFIGGAKPPSAFNSHRVYEDDSSNVRMQAIVQYSSERPAQAINRAQTLLLQHDVVVVVVYYLPTALKSINDIQVLLCRELCPSLNDGRGPLRCCLPYAVSPDLSCGRIFELAQQLIDRRVGSFIEQVKRFERLGPLPLSAAQTTRRAHVIGLQLTNAEYTKAVSMHRRAMKGATKQAMPKSYFDTYASLAHVLSDWSHIGIALNTIGAAFDREHG